MERKEAIRKELLHRRNEIEKEVRERDNGKILRQLLENPWYLQAENILLYISFGSEADTLNLCEHCFRQGKRVYCPKILKKGEMGFYAIASLEELESGAWGILEPPTHTPFDERRLEKTLLIMPLVGFDKKGNRLGYGGGFYDRYLAGKNGLRTIALAYDEQCWQSELPIDEYDIQPKKILTPTGYLDGTGYKHCKSSRKRGKIC